MFTSKCFIRKNTEELRQILVDLGYSIDSTVGIDPEDLAIIAEDGLYFTWDIFPDYKPWRSIDCGENEELFIALASLRDDSDRFQWFTDDSCEVWEREGDLDFSGYLLQWHKATTKELIKKYER